MGKSSSNCLFGHAGRFSRTFSSHSFGLTVSASWNRSLHSWP